jgi:hypothetical protein
MYRFKLGKRRKALLSFDMSAANISARTVVIRTIHRGMNCSVLKGG